VDPAVTHSVNPTVAAPVVPPIYAISPVPQKLTNVGRLIALSVALACFALLATAVFLRPSATGVATHTALGFDECHFLLSTGIPCPSCGMTTSFAWFVRGHVLASFYVQPMGTLLAIAAGMTFWGGLYVAATGKPVYRRLFAELPPSYYVIAPLGFAIAAWGWKIFIHVRGIDGW
jgi:hypothetical protein